MHHLVQAAILAGMATSACAVIAAGALPQAVGPAIDRPALAGAHPERSVLLGAALAGKRIVVVGERGIILCSDDGGVNWTQSKSPVSVTLTSVRFANEKAGWAAGHGGTILATQDGGKTWVRQLDGVRAAKLLLAQAVAQGSERAIKDAQRLVADGADKPFLDLHFFDERRGLAVGAYNLAFLTGDGGVTWVPLSGLLDNPQAMHLYAVRARGTTVVIAGEQGLVLLSGDGGATFRRIETPYSGTFFTAEILHDGAIWLGGLRGNVWRSADAGGNWQAMHGQSNAPTGASITASTVASDGMLLLGSQSGQTLQANSESLRLRPGAPVGPVTGLLPLPDGRLLTLTLRGATVQAASDKGSQHP
ncbi:photosystem II stability/assembly factor-like uncharacterized protein [Acidovorax sp. 69]|uniref:WD40/YVTN/BNR-like repeat-containing protein n=1 Tax=Acidovorax sp. 69 TaxID=2035202 RepID=UPI000C249A0D|nr:YCF48-related protein [Acidovorax sp. 69]PJI95830.1 photosystem II stability/assembly factor-like uncharacterized protein [Acidovorax sp. 69]